MGKKRALYVRIQEDGQRRFERVGSLLPTGEADIDQRKTHSLGIIEQKDKPTERKRKVSMLDWMDLEKQVKEIDKRIAELEDAIREKQQVEG